MPRDKKLIHRATSDVEDEEDNEDEVLNEEKSIIKGQENFKTSSNLNEKFQDSNDLIEERRKYLKNIILKRTLALKQQRERDRQQRVRSTQKQ
jgi:hypothetical protein